ncbi:MAG: hypothetical protein OXN17_14470 [Candidatus Poribacteria bacterium]|nr:hypothetical protein [Candidatus Poribacteria bacterium]
MEAKEGRGTKNHQVLWGSLITLVIGIFAFAQVYIMFTLNHMDDRMSRLDDRVNEHLTQIEARLDKLNRNYIAHLEHRPSGN